MSCLSRASTNVWIASFHQYPVSLEELQVIIIPFYSVNSQDFGHFCDPLHVNLMLD